MISSATLMFLAVMFTLCVDTANLTADTVRKGLDLALAGDKRAAVALLFALTGLAILAQMIGSMIERAPDLVQIVSG